MASPFRSGIVGALAFAVLAASPAGTAYGERSERSVDSLAVNPLNTYRMVSRKDEAAGIADMRRDLGQAFDEAWAYLPQAQKWVEIGVDEQPTVRVGVDEHFIRYRARHALDWEFVEGILRKNNDVALYHTRPVPSYVIRDGVETLLEKYQLEPDDTTAMEVARESLYITAALPSPNDLKNMAERTLASLRLNPRAQVAFKISSPLGITEYGLTPEGVTFCRRKPRAARTLLEDVVSGVRVAATVVAQGTPEERIREGMRFMMADTGNRLRVSFIPYAD